MRKNTENTENIMFISNFLGKTRVPHKKNTAKMPPVRMPNASSVLLPMSQHIGAPAEPIVSVGDRVKIGQKIAEARGAVSSPIYATVSGRVSAIETYLRADGKKIPAVRIESDGLMEVYEGIVPPTVTDTESFVESVRESGLVGLGGAGFPTAVKLEALKNGKIDTIVINGAECEPYITSDTRTMLDRSERIYRGIAIIETYVRGIDRYIFGIEKNKPECISVMRDMFRTNEKVKITALPSLYPQGAEKVLIYNTTKRIVPEGKLPSDVGVLVLNVTSLAILAKYIETGMPLVERCVTLDGSAVKDPKNIIAPIGVSLSELIEFGGGLTDDAGKVLFGGPMMGMAACSLDEPIVKTTGAVTVMTVGESLSVEETACIHCGRCVSACPLFLNPTEYSKALELKSKEDRIERLNKYKVLLCMECGCCSYVCPANRPLVQNNRLAKKELREHRAHSSMLKN